VILNKISISPDGEDNWAISSSGVGAHPIKMRINRII
jgi:hypothetical protein